MASESNLVRAETEEIPKSVIFQHHDRLRVCMGIGGQASGGKRGATGDPTEREGCS